MEFGTIEREIYVEASPEVVFEVVSSPDHLQQWWPDEAHYDPVPGSTGEIVFGKPGDGQLPAQRCGRAVAIGEQEVEDPPPGRVADRRPQLVVDALHDAGGHGRTPSASVYTTNRGR